MSTRLETWCVAEETAKENRTWQIAIDINTDGHSTTVFVPVFEAERFAWEVMQRCHEWRKRETAREMTGKGETAAVECSRCGGEGEYKGADGWPLHCRRCGSTGRLQAEAAR